jgi:hypothetical protein
LAQIEKIVHIRANNLSKNGRFLPKMSIPKLGKSVA